MKLRNKKTGELGYFCFANCDSSTLIIMDENGIQLAKYSSLAELNKEWKDYEEPEIIWYLDWKGRVQSAAIENNWDKEKSIGNYFESREEAEKAVEKLKALKRLKDKGLRFRWIDMQTGQIKYSLFLKDGQKNTRKDEDDLLLIFGGEE